MNRATSSAPSRVARGSLVRIVRFAVASTSLLSTTACASGVGETADPPAFEGCYRFANGPGLGLPWGVQLVDAPLDGWPSLPDARLARTFLAASELADHPFGFWADAAGDSIRVAYPAAGAITLVLALGGNGTSLSGRGSAAGDAVPFPGTTPTPSPPVPVTAERVACPAE